MMMRMKKREESVLRARGRNSSGTMKSGLNNSDIQQTSDLSYSLQLAVEHFGVCLVYRAVLISCRNSQLGALWHMVLFVKATTAFITSHPETDFRPRLALREVLRSLCSESKRESQIFRNRRDSAELLTSYSPDS